MDNAADLHEWSIPVAEATKVREISPCGGVTLEISLRPFAVSPNDMNTVRTQIIAFKMLESRTGTLLYEHTVPASEWRTISTGKDAIPDQLDSNTLELTGVRLGMDRQAVKAALTDQVFFMDEKTMSEGYAFVPFSTYAEGLIRIDPFLGTMEAADAQQSGNLGKKLDCGDETRIQSCGIIRFDRDHDTVTSVAFLQSATNVSKQDVVASVSAKFGYASDRFDAYTWRTYATDQYVWGGFTNDSTIAAHSFTEISGPKHWQVKAFVMEPAPKRVSVVVQINKIQDDQAVTSQGGIKF